MNRNDPHATALAWRRASRCANGSCVLVAVDGNNVHITDSKDPNAPVITITRQAWTAFITAITNGDHT